MKHLSELGNIQSLKALIKQNDNHLDYIKQLLPDFKDYIVQTRISNNKLIISVSPFIWVNHIKEALMLNFEKIQRDLSVNIQEIKVRYLF